MLDWYVNRKGFANVLADGIRKTAKTIGGNAMEYVRTMPPLIKGLPFGFAMIIPKYGYIIAMASSVSMGGQHYLKGNAYSMMKRVPLDQRVKVATELSGIPNALEWFVPAGKAYLTFIWENLLTTFDATGICKFASDYLWKGTIGFNETAELLSAATGLKYNVDNLMEIGDRITLTERAYNVREGIKGREHDTIPNQVLESKFGEKIEKEKFEKMLDEYYLVRGCEKTTGVPTKEKLESMGLGFVADDLTKRGIKLSEY